MNVKSTVGLLVSVLGMSFFAPSASAAPAQELHLRYNMHCYVRGRAPRTVNAASYANYLAGGGHFVVPFGTKVTVKKSRRVYVFTIVETGKKVSFEFHTRNMGMKWDEYLKLITSSEAVSYPDLPAKDLEGIKAGKALVGMTKKGVKIALGYPAVHRTPSLDDKTWTYWRNRFGTLTVTFDDKGLVVSTNP